MNRRSERQAVAAVEISFYSARAGPFGGVEVNTHEDCIAIRVGDCNPCPQWNKDITVPSHHYAIAAGCQNISKTLRDIECHVFFCNPLAGNPAAIMTSMSRIDNYSDGRAAASRGAAPLRCRGIASCQKCDEQTCDR